MGSNAIRVVVSWAPLESGFTGAHAFVRLASESANREESPWKQTRNFSESVVAAFGF